MGVESRRLVIDLLENKRASDEYENLCTLSTGYPPSDLFLLFAHLGLGHWDSQRRRGYSVFVIAVGEADSLCKHSPDDYGLKMDTLPCCGQLGLNVCILWVAQGGLVCPTTTSSRRTMTLFYIGPHVAGGRPSLLVMTWGSQLTLFIVWLWHSPPLNLVIVIDNLLGTQSHCGLWH